MIHSCRLCLADYPEQKLNNIFQYEVKAEDSLVDILFWVFAVEIDVLDPYAKQICNDCVLLIEYVVEVRNTFQKNQENLRKDYQEKKSQELGGYQFSKRQQNDTECQSEEENNKGSVTPTKCRGKYSYGQSSPRVRVSLAALETICPLTLDVEKWEKSSEYMRYKHIGDGVFKKRKYRHFNIDDKLLDDICSELDDKKCVKTEVFKKDVCVSTDDLFKHSELWALTSLPGTLSSTFLNGSGENTTKSEVTKVTTLKKGKGDEFDGGSLLDVLKISQEISSSLSTEVDKDYDWTRLTFKKDAGINTEPCTPIPTSDIGINVEAETVEAGIQTKRFKQIHNKKYVRVNVQALTEYSPKVHLEPVEYLMGRENYKEIDDFCYVKCEGDSDIESSEEPEIMEESFTEDIEKFADSHQDVIKVKKQRYLDYYKNFSSFAVRELIAGKAIRDNHSESSDMFKVSNVCSVLVCNFCSKTFLSQAVLNLHCRRAHKSIGDANEVHNHKTPPSEPQTKKFVFKTMFARPQKKNKRKVGRPPKNKINHFNEMPHDFIGSCNGGNKIPCSLDSSSIHEKIAEDPLSGEIIDNNLPPEIITDNIRLHDSITNTVRLTEEELGKKSSNVSCRPPRRSTSTDLSINNIAKKRTAKSSRKPVIAKQIRRRRRKRKNVTDETDGKGLDTSYIWDRKGFGKYSAITFYRKDIKDEKHCNNAGDTVQKQDISLNETIRKLADRLDEFSNFQKLEPK